MVTARLAVPRVSRVLALIFGLAPAPVAAQASPLWGAASTANFAYIDSPPPLPLDRGPEPAAVEEEYGRRPWELMPEAGVALPLCRGDGLGPGHCAQADAGLGTGAGFFFRPTPSVALGVTAHRGAFAFHPEGAVGSDASSQVGWIGLAARAYFIDRGRWDPYVEVGFGRLGLDTAFRLSNGANMRLSAAAPATVASAGLDVWAGAHWKLGPRVTYRHGFVGSMHVCQDGAGCWNQSIGSAGAPAASLDVSLTATFAFGATM